MQKSTNQCPSCNTAFKKPDKHSYGDFCPHCGIQLFKETSIENPQTSTLKQQSFANFIEAFIWVSFTFLFLVLFIVSGIYDCYKPYKNYFENLFFIAFFAWLAYESYKSRQQPQLFIAGVDSLTDYQTDNCDYKISHSNASSHQCPMCRSHRMVDIFWFQRRTTQPLDLPHDKDNFVGCLNCHAHYTTNMINNNTHNRLIWLWSIIYISVIIMLYFAINHVMDIDNVSFYCVVFGMLFMSSQTKLHQNNPVNVVYQEIATKSMNKQSKDKL